MCGSKVPSPDELQHVVDLAGVAIVDPITDSWFQKIG